MQVPDVAWASSGFFSKHGDATPFPEAPEICVEIVSPSNSDEEIRDKTRAYIAAGAREVWIVDENGSVRFYDESGDRSSSNYTVVLSPPAPAPHS